MKIETEMTRDFLCQNWDTWTALQMWEETSTVKVVYSPPLSLCF